jgi:XTP/dITP diphosphohydrolase
MKLIIGSRNRDKFREISGILSGLGVEVVPVTEYPDVPEVVEDGETLEENAVKKAAAVCAATNELVLAEDTGLEVDYLKGAPGVYSARFAGPGCTYADNNRKLLKELEGVPEAKRTARFRCVAAVARPGREVITAEGAIEGYILDRTLGDGGFGYDPLFYVKEYKKTFAQLPLDIKNRISHRARAISEARKVLVEILKGGD